MQTLFVNGSVFDGARHRPGLQVAVRAGRIAAIGADLRELRGPRTQVVDLVPNGRPGLAIALAEAHLRRGRARLRRRIDQ